MGPGKLRNLFSNNTDPNQFTYNEAGIYFNSATN